MLWLCLQYGLTGQYRKPSFSVSWGISSLEYCGALISSPKMDHQVNSFLFRFWKAKNQIKMCPINDPSWASIFKPLMPPWYTDWGFTVFYKALLEAAFRIKTEKGLSTFQKRSFISCSVFLKPIFDTFYNISGCFRPVKNHHFWDFSSFLFFYLTLQ